jgi:hypothetical protein
MRRDELPSLVFLVCAWCVLCVAACCVLGAWLWLARLQQPTGRRSTGQGESQEGARHAKD